MQKTRSRVYRHTVKPTCAYLEPIRNTMHRPIEGEVTHPKNVGGEVAIGIKIIQTDVEKPAAPAYYTLNKGAIDKNHAAEQSLVYESLNKKHTKKKKKTGLL